jgi:HEAT repeat protein
MRSLLVVLGAVLGAVLAVACTASESDDRWQPGTAYRYTVAMTSEARAEAAANAPPMFDFALKGDVEVTPVAAEPGGPQIMLLAFKRAEITTTQGEAAKARFAQVATELQRPHAFAFVNGQQSEAWLAKDIQAVTVGILRNIAGQLQLPAPRDGAERFEVEEYDATGRYKAEYRAVGKAGDGALQYERRKLSYAALIMGDNARSAFSNASASPKLTESSGTLVVSGTLLRSMSAKETLEVELVAGRKLATQTSLTMSLAERKPADPQLTLAAVQRDAVKLAASEPYQHVSSKFDLDQAKIGDRTFDQVVSELEAEAQEHAKQAAAAGKTANGQPSGGGRSMAAFVALSAMLRRSSADVDGTVALVRGESIATPALVSALGAAGSEAAQAALVALMSDARLSDSIRNQAGYALLRTKTPVVQSARALQGWLGDAKWHSHAELGLGTFTRLFRDAGNDEAMKTFGDALVTHLQSRSSNGERVAVLTALGNAGYDAALPALQPLLRDEDQDVRAAAVQALRLMKSPEVDARLIEAALKDADRAPRVGALQAMANREPTPALIEAAGQRLTSDSDNTVKLAAIQVFEQWARTNAAARAALERAASAEPAEPIRKAAQSALARVGASASL